MFPLCPPVETRGPGSQGCRGRECSSACPVLSSSALPGAGLLPAVSTCVTVRGSWSLRIDVPQGDSPLANGSITAVASSTSTLGTEQLSGEAHAVSRAPVPQASPLGPLGRACFSAARVFPFPFC